VKTFFDACEVLVDLVVGEQRPRVVAKARIADACRTAAHESDGLVPGLLQPA